MSSRPSASASNPGRRYSWSAPGPPWSTIAGRPAPTRRTNSSAPGTWTVSVPLTWSEQHRQGVRYLPDLRLLLGRERVGDVAVDVDLAQDGGAPPDEHHQLRASPRIAGDVVRDGAHVGHVLILPGG